MNSFQALNNFGAQTIEVDDTRPATVIFDVDPKYVELDTEVTYTSTTSTFSSPINVEEIRNYATANLRFRVSVITRDITPGSTINFGALPTGITQNLVGEVYTLSGFKTKIEWDSIIDFIWTRPNDYTNAGILFLKLELLYYDAAANTEKVIDWVYYDELYYYIAYLENVFSLTASETRLRDFNVSITSAFSPVFEIRRFVGFEATFSSAFSLVTEAVVTCVVAASSQTALTAIAGGVRGFNSQMNITSTNLIDTYLTKTLVNTISIPDPRTSSVIPYNAFSENTNYLVSCIGPITGVGHKLRYYELSADKTSVLTTSDIVIDTTTSQIYPNTIDVDTTGEITQLVAENTVYTVRKSTGVVTKNTSLTGADFGNVSSDGLRRWYYHRSSPGVALFYYRIYNTTTNSLLTSLTTSTNRGSADIAYDSTNSRYWFPYVGDSATLLAHSANNFTSPTTLVNGISAYSVTIDNTATYIAAGGFYFSGLQLTVRIFKRTGTTWTAVQDINVASGAGLSVTYMKFTPDGRRLFIQTGIAGLGRIYVYDRYENTTTYNLQLDALSDSFLFTPGRDGGFHPPWSFSENGKWFTIYGGTGTSNRIYRLI